MLNRKPLFQRFCQVGVTFLSLMFCAMSASSGKNPDDDHIFQGARDNFLASLSAEERVHFPTCTSADNLINNIKAPDAFKNNHRRWTRILNRFKNFADQLQPYFEVMNIVLQSHPEWTAIAFGAFRLVIQVRFFYQIQQFFAQQVLIS
jgi:hypothetical protein